MGVLDSLKDAISPDKMIGVIEKWIPPTGRLAISLLPKMMQSTFDTSKHNIPTVEIKKHATELKIAVVYKFDTPEARDAFYDSEYQNLQAISMLTEVLNGLKAEKTPPEGITR